MDDRSDTSVRRRALWALLLLVPAPTLGTLAGMWLWQGQALGMSLYALSKVWLLGFPLVWLVWIERGRLSWSPPSHGGLGVGLMLGIAIALVITAAYLLVGRQWIEPDVFRGIAIKNGLETPATCGSRIGTPIDSLPSPQSAKHIPPSGEYIPGEVLEQAHRQQGPSPVLSRARER